MQTTQTTQTTAESIYGNERPALEQACAALSEHIAAIRAEMTAELGMDPVEHYLTRIKSADSSHAVRAFILGFQSTESRVKSLE